MCVVEKEIGRFGTEELIELFEFVISPADRIEVLANVLFRGRALSLTSRQIRSTKSHEISRRELSVA